MKEKKSDGRRNNGAKKGQNRGAGKKPRDPNEGARVKASPTFKPSHWALIKETGRPVTDVLDDALDLYFKQ